MLHQQSERLLQSALFEDWQDVPLQLVQHHIQKITYYTGQYIYREGSVDAFLYIILDGQVKLDKVFNNARKALASIVAPDYFGDYELADIDEKANFQIPKRQMSALSVSVSVVLKINLI